MYAQQKETPHFGVLVQFLLSLMHWNEFAARFDNCGRPATQTPVSGHWIAVPDSVAKQASQVFSSNVLKF